MPNPGSTPASNVVLGLNLQVIDQLQAQQNPLVNRALAGLIYGSLQVCVYDAYLIVRSAIAVNVFTNSLVPVVYVRNAGTSGVLNLNVAFNGAAGSILTSSIYTFGFPSSGYAVGDTGVVVGPNNNATYIVNSVDGSGKVLTYTITSGGTGYSLGNDVATGTGGAQPGVGVNFRINILSIGNGNSPQFVTLNPGGIFLYYNQLIDAAADNTIASLTLSSQNGYPVLVEYLYAA